MATVEEILQLMRIEIDGPRDAIEALREWHELQDQRIEALEAGANRPDIPPSQPGQIV